MKDRSIDHRNKLKINQQYINRNKNSSKKDFNY